MSIARKRIPRPTKTKPMRGQWVGRAERGFRSAFKDDATGRLWVTAHVLSTKYGFAQKLVDQWRERRLLVSARARRAKATVWVYLESSAKKMAERDRIARSAAATWARLKQSATDSHSARSGDPSSGTLRDKYLGEHPIIPAIIADGYEPTIAQWHECTGIAASTLRIGLKGKTKPRLFGRGDGSIETCSAEDLLAFALPRAGDPEPEPANSFALFAGSDLIFNLPAGTTRRIFGAISRNQSPDWLGGFKPKYKWETDRIVGGAKSKNLRGALREQWTVSIVGMTEVVDRLNAAMSMAKKDRIERGVLLTNEVTEKLGITRCYLYSLNKTIWPQLSDSSFPDGRRINVIKGRHLLPNGRLSKPENEWALPDLKKIWPEEFADDLKIENGDPTTSMIVDRRSALPVVIKAHVAGKNVAKGGLTGEQQLRTPKKPGRKPGYERDEDILQFCEDHPNEKLRVVGKRFGISKSAVCMAKVRARAERARGRNTR